MKLVTWNINSIRAREATFLSWLEKNAPDVVCLQETKVTDDLFPGEAIEQLGYHVAVFGQPAYNGVALLSRQPLTNISRGFGDGVDDPQARLIAATTYGVRVASAYVPNGTKMGTDKQAYKSAWLRRMRRWLEREGRQHPSLVVSGDYNIAPRASDVYNPEKWVPTVLFHPEMRAELAHVMSWGLSDVYADRYPDGGSYSWWDYRTDGYARGEGLRIDLILTTPDLARRVQSAVIDHQERRSERPSDHAPVIAEFAL